MTWTKGRDMGEMQSTLSIHVGPVNGIRFVDQDGETRFVIPPDRDMMLRLGAQIINAALEVESP